MTFRTRFAPSPTGPLHLGHAYSAGIGHAMAQHAGGTFLLRIEDLDADRSKSVWESAIYEDLRWLGITWEGDALRQSDRLRHYHVALDRMANLGVVYPCSCKRADILAAVSAPQEGAAVYGPDGLVYPGTCRGRRWESRKPEDAIRLNIRRALDCAGPLPAIRETGGVTHPAPDPDRMVATIGDVVLARRTTGAPAYHLAVVVDDAAQGITHVVRGADLAEATEIHILLQALLRLPHPIYHHHALVRDDTGKRLAKRDDARAIATYRDAGLSPADVRRLAGLPDQAGSGAMVMTSDPSSTKV